MSNEQLADLTQPQRDRLALVELRVRSIGEIRGQDLVTRFGIQSAAASSNGSRVGCLSLRLMIIAIVRFPCSM